MTATLSALLDRTAAARPGQTMRFWSENQSVTYAELAAAARGLAAELVAEGVRPGDPVGVLSPNAPEFSSRCSRSRPRAAPPARCRFRSECATSAATGGGWPASPRPRACANLRTQYLDPSEQVIPWVCNNLIVSAHFVRSK